ncbi:MarR family winged helix-turn-helix transcriptional regulator [Pseudolabrys taiwanensis]|nr:MarR family transcriptional regulator [Pseudolabrys taiwanensis]
MHKNQANDAIDIFIAEWARQRPDLDFQYLATVGRVVRIAAHLRERMDTWLKPFGLTWEMFDLLASLQRSGDARGLRPTALYEACMLSSGATTNRIDRAEKLKLATRKPDPDDGRAARIALTKRGHAITAEAMTEHSYRAQEIADHLTQREQETLEALLRKLLRGLETAKEKEAASARS